MTTANPMTDPSVLERAVAAKRGKPFPAPRGGNGTGMTIPQAQISAAFPSLVIEFSVGVPASIRLGTGVRRYSLDLALPERKLAIEVDGISHRTKTGRSRDAHKGLILAALGWSLLRVSNEDVMERWEQTQERVRLFLT
jgi:hypothetical protein